MRHILHSVFIHLFNLLLCFFSQEAILDIKQIRVSYLRTWFIPDVIAAFPIGYILLFAVIIKGLLKQQKANCMLQYLSVHEASSGRNTHIPKTSNLYHSCKCAQQSALKVSKEKIYTLQKWPLSIIQWHQILLPRYFKQCKSSGAPKPQPVCEVSGNVCHLKVFFNRPK